MKLSVVSAVCLTIWCLSARRAQSQGTSVSDATNSVSNGLGQFALELLTKTSVEGGPQLNIIMSTYSIWNLLAILHEGAAGTTANQLRSTLRIPADNARFKTGYKNINRILNVNRSGVEISIANAIFADKDYRINKAFEYETSTQYNVNVLPVDFKRKQEAAQYIDSILAKATNNRLKNFINFDDLSDAKLLLTTAIFFKGAWSIPFNKTATKSEIFYDENQNPIGNVQMMYQGGLFPFSRFEELQAHAVALPYGQDEKYWMILFKPFDGVPLNNVLTQLIQVPFKSIIARLESDLAKFEDEVIVYLPKFKMTSDFVLNVILEKMGIVDVFDPYYADLAKISQGLYLSRIIHKAEIEVDEEGTTASGITGGVLSYKQMQGEFRANRPFAYFIVEKDTSTILFAGKLSNPNDLI